jgi:hypothetical protein
VVLHHARADVHQGERDNEQEQEREQFHKTRPPGAV